MTSWIVGDIHGCARELEALVGRLRPSPGDHLVSVGDLFHRGPEPLRVMELLEEHDFRFVLGNHERKVLERCGLAPRRADARDRPAPLHSFPEIAAEDLDGDGGAPCHAAGERGAEILRFLQRHSGYFLRRSDVEGGSAREADWCVVHAGRLPGVALERNPIGALTSLRHLPEPGRPWWYERWHGPELVLFGHTPSALPRAWRVAGRLLALGLDTGCVYGGRLTAYSPELDELVSVDAARAYARSPQR